MTRELKLALIVGFSLVLVVTVLISDHLSRARQTELAGDIPSEPALVPAAPGVTPMPERPVASGGHPLPTEVIVPQPEQVAQAEPPVTELDMGRPKPSEALVAASQEDLIKEIIARGGDVAESGFTLPAAARADSKPLVPAGPSLVSQVPVQLIPVAPQPEVTAAAPSATHVVASGESAYKIAKKYYGTGNVWKKLADHNKGRISPDGRVRVGVKLTIPPAEVVLGKGAASKLVATPPTEAPAAKPGTPKTKTTGAPAVAPAKPSKADSPTRVANYTVRKGDTLGSIAQRELGTVKRASEILSLNRRVIKDPNNVPLGVTLKMPAA